ncbi:hypothetical protein DFH09DRAFT_1072729 [Mycena vulgaris]|nr:hypothetical protein DFH09DRAFT_1072729 [Mycena vulgaris]
MNNPPITSFHYYEGTDFLYKSLFFKATGLDANAQHTVTWILEKSSVGGTAASFDYADFTVDQADISSTSSATTTGTLAPATHKSKAGQIAGAVVAVVVGLALLGAAFIYLRRRRRTGWSTMPSTANVDAENYNSPSPRTVASLGYSVEPYGYQPATIGSAPSAIVPSPFTSPQMSTVSSSLKSRPEQPLALAPDAQRPDPQRPDPARSRDLEVEERLRHLEALAASSQPPAYE